MIDTVRRSSTVNHTALPKLSSGICDKEFISLLELSVRLGCDPLLVQANNGNTSVKLDGVLWIKASGKCLANAKREQTFVPVELAVIKESLRNNMEIAQTNIRYNQLQPSIETAMHAVLQHHVVVHVHSVNTIAWAIREDGPRQLSKRLAGLYWQWVPYVPSGIPLARELEKFLRDAPETNVFVLGNHGLVVCGRDCECVEALLREVERRLAIMPRPSPGPVAGLFTVISRSSQWRFPDLQALHALGTDAISRMILRKGILYPCQVIFLGPKLTMLPCSVPLSRLADYFNGRAEAQSYAIVEGGGVIINEKIYRAEYETLIALMQIVQRVEASAPLRYLTEIEIASVLGDGTHRYRESVLTGQPSHQITLNRSTP
jgi:rhamnose utilization protein RhaD (predicted bifunctional aldolase and dehydrogenase)